MKFSVVVCALVVCLAFAGRVCAQTYTPGELRATAIVTNAQVTADAQRRRVDAPTATPLPPTATSTPTVPPTLTSTPSPTAFYYIYIATVVDRMFGPTPIPTPAAQKEDRTAIYVVAGIVVLIVIVAVWALLFRPQVFILPNRPRR